MDVLLSRMRRRRPSRRARKSAHLLAITAKPLRSGDGTLSVGFHLTQPLIPGVGGLGGGGLLRFGVALPDLATTITPRPET